MFTMTIDDFYDNVTKKWEKGKVNHPNDPGGVTNDGVATHFITDFALKEKGDKFLRSIGITPVFIMGYLNKQASKKTKIFSPNLLLSFTPKQCKAILLEAFWVWTKLNKAPAKMSAYAAFDFGVNSGERRGVKYLQLACNSLSKSKPALDADGLMGPKTNARLEEFVDLAKDYKLAMTVCDKRMSFLKGLSTFSSFGRGWTNRVNGVRTFLKGYEKWVK